MVTGEFTVSCTTHMSAARFSHSICASHNSFQYDATRLVSYSAEPTALAYQPFVGILESLRPAYVLLDLPRQARNHAFGAGGVTAGTETGHVVIESVEYRHFGLLAMTDPAGCPILTVDKMGPK